MSTPRIDRMVAELNGERYFVATKDEVGQYARDWGEEYISSQQEAELTRETAIPLHTFHEGAGFSYQGAPGTYSHASGLVADAPGSIVGWPQFASGQQFSSADNRGWMTFIDPYLYVMRGRFVVKYEVGGTGEWSILEKHDLGENIGVAGRPAQFQGKLYVPRINLNTDTLQVFHELTTIATTVTEEQTIAITGTPTGGTYTITFDGKTTTSLAHDADQAAVQSALRALAGLELVTVVTTGSSPDVTHTVTMTGVGGDLTNASPPEMTSTNNLTGGSSPTITHNTTVAGTVDTWTAGEGDIKPICFTLWENKLVEAEEDAEVRTCATTPTTDSNWSPDPAGAGYPVGDSGVPITDLATWGRFLMVGKEDGLWSFDEDLQTIPRLPDLAVFKDSQNCIGMTEVGGFLYVPHIAGLVRWAPGEYAIIGPNSEGGLQGDITPGWGRVASLVAYGGVLYWVTNDLVNNVASLGSAALGLGQRALASHFLWQFEDEFTEAVTAVINQAQPAQFFSPDTLSDDSAVGTITWSNPGDAAAEDGDFASATTGTTHYLKALNPDPSVPDGATITGVVVEIVRRVGV